MGVETTLLKYPNCGGKTKLKYVDTPKNYKADLIKYSRNDITNKIIKCEK